jgi:hypothetical protein
MLLVAGICGAQALSLRDQRFQDLEILRSSYAERTLSLTSESRARALHLISDLEKRAGTLSAAEFLVGIYEVTAIANNAHDAVSIADPSARPALRAPFRLIWFPDALLIARAQGAAADLAGGRVRAIEGRTPDALFESLRRLCGGTDIYCRWMLPALIESGGVLHALGLAASPDHLRVAVDLPDGRRIERSIALTTAAQGPQPSGGPGRFWSPEALAGESGQGWRTALPAQSAPLYLRDGETPFRTEFLAAQNALYVQYRANYDIGGFDIRSFTASIAAEIKARHPRHLIFDLRFNGGGDITTTARAMRELPKMVSGRIFILIGRYTFSAGMVAAAILKKAAGDRAVVVGEEVGDRPRFWSEGQRVCLPNSRICVQRTDGQWDLANGCANEPHCYGDQFAAKVGSLAPQIRAPLTAAAYLSGRDPGMEAVVSYLRTA